MEDNIILFTIGCPKCNVLKTKLDRAGIHYVICEDKNKMIEQGITLLPMLKINDSILNFNQAVEWINNK